MFVGLRPALERGYLRRVESGRFDQISPAELLRRFADRRATGRLDLDRSGVRSMLYFRRGRVYAATAPIPRTRLGERLVDAGLLDEGALAVALRAQAAAPSPVRIGEVLVERGHCDLDTVRDHLREQMAAAVSATIGWTQGTWSFRPGDQVLEDAPFDESVDDLIMEAARRLERWDVIHRRVGSLDVVLDLRSGPPTDVALTPDEWSILSGIDGVSTIAEIAADAGCSDLQAGRIAFGLLATGVLRVAPEPTVAAAEAAGMTPERAELLREFASLEPRPELPEAEQAGSPQGADGGSAQGTQDEGDEAGGSDSGRRGLFRGRRGERTGRPPAG